MTTPTPTRGWWSRAASLIGWSLAALVILALLAYLVVAVLVLRVFGRPAAGHDETVEWQRDDNRRWASQAQERLVTAAADGTLTDAELATALGKKWTVDRSSDQRLTVVAEYTGTDDGRLCYTYAFTLPLGPESRVTRTESDKCPEFPYRPPSTGN